MKYTINQTVKRTTVDRMKSLCENYNTRQDYCGCGETKIVSSMMGINIPCSHRVYMGALFPACPVLNIRLKEQWDTLILDFNILPPDDNIEEYDEKKADIQYAVNVIRKFSKYKKVDKIIKFVEEKYDPARNEFFISGRPIELLSLISLGITKFIEIADKE